MNKVYTFTSFYHKSSIFSLPKTLSQIYFNAISSIFVPIEANSGSVYCRDHYLLRETAHLLAKVQLFIENLLETYTFILKQLALFFYKR